MKKWMQDLILGIVLLLFSTVSFVYAYIMRDASTKYFMARADTYVLLWTGILGMLSLVLIIRSIKNKPHEAAPKIITKRVIVTVIIIAIYIVLLEILGFIISSLFFLLALLLFFTFEAKPDLKGQALKKDLILCGVIAVISVLVVYYLFGVALGVRLPAGIFG